MTLENDLVNASDQELVSRAQKGETRAFEELVYRYDRKVLSIAHSFTNDPDDAKDIYQEVFVRIYRALPGFRFGSQFSTWVYRIVMNVCLSHKRHRHGLAQASIDEVPEKDLYDNARNPSPRGRAVLPDSYAENSEIRKHVQQAVDALSPRERLVFTLKHYEGYKLREIASMMECGEGTVKRYLFVATEKLKHKLKKIYR